VVLFRKDFLGEGEAEHMVEDLGLKEWVEAQGGDLDNIIKEINLGTFPQELMLYEQVIKETIRETLGQSNFQRARRENVESAEEASRIGMGDDTQVGRNQSAMEEFITDSVRKWHQGLRAVATDDILVPLLDEQDARELVKNTNNPYLRATPKQIQGEFLFRMRLGSSRPTNEQREKQEAMVMLEMMQRFPERMVADQFIVDWLMAFNKSPSRYMLNAEEIQATGANVPPGEPGMPGGGNGASPVTADPNILSTFIGTNR
jgi:hypothetical protein